MTMTYLYHYTNADGVLGILQSRAFWTSKSSFMNDPSELRYARDLIGNQVNQMSATYDQNFRDAFFAELDATLVYDDIYILSFSLAPDALSMWNRYGKNDGYCLCVNAANLNSHLAKDFGEIFVGEYKTIYEQEAQEQLISATLECLINEHRKSTFNVGHIKKDITALILKLLFSLKHPCYREELEVRYIFAIPNQLGSTSPLFEDKTQFRTRGGLIYPYIEIGIDPSALFEKVIIGPANESTMSHEGMDMLLRKHIGGKAIVSSGVPFRVTGN